jgi:hypothetical protein
VRRLPLALPLALALLAASATSARGACLDEPAAAATEEASVPAEDSHEGDCSDCEGGCSACFCCQAPVALGATAGAPAAAPPHAPVPPRTSLLAGELHRAGVFQPPRG